MAKPWIQIEFAPLIYLVPKGRGIKPLFVLLGSEIRKSTFLFLSLYVGNKACLKGSFLHTYIRIEKVFIKMWL